MPTIRAQVSIPANSTVSEDTVTNTFHFDLDTWSETIRGQISGGLQALYESIDTWKSTLQDWDSARVKFYDLSDPIERVPIDDISLGLTNPPAGTPLPTEIAMVLSFHGDYVSGGSQARRRGRVYLGPLNAAVMGTTGLFSSTPTTALQTGAATFLALSESSAWNWVVYSPTADTVYEVTAGWVDNAPDVQRRRGIKSGARLLF